MSPLKPPPPPTPPTSNVEVICRIRPPPTATDISLLQADENLINSYASPSSPHPSKTFRFTSAYSPTSQTSALFTNHVKTKLIDEMVFKGYNATVMAYGQTGSGKTHTMGTNFGNGDNGIIPSSINHIFSTTDTFPPSSKATVKMSYLEIHNEELRDLLSTTAPPPPLTISDGGGQTIVQNLIILPVTSPLAVFELMKTASSRRVTAATGMNETSSRSHAICTVYVSLVHHDESDVDVDMDMDMDVAATATATTTTATATATTI